MQATRSRQIPLSRWLPTSRREMEQRGWEQPDVVLVTGDAYVDHPAFGAAVIGRIIEEAGLRVAILPQPNWRDDWRDFRRFGPPRLFFGVTSGNMDSMVNHYTAGRRLRSNDAYTPDGQAGFRPDYAVTVYSHILKELYPEVPVVLGGMEASLRRVTHYDYWSDSLKPGILVDSGADLLLYGMAEQALQRLLQLLEQGVPWSSLRTLPQAAFLLAEGEQLPKNRHWETLELASHEQCCRDRRIYAGNFARLEQEMNRLRPYRLTQRIGSSTLVVNPPLPPINTAALDAIYDLPFTRLPHPRYRHRGPIPAWEMIKHSMTLHRGCFGGCSFCTIAAHQGKFVSSRSQASIMRELDVVTDMPGFKGQISDLGGPSANMYRMRGLDFKICESCSRPSCLAPTLCSNLNLDHGPLLKIYRAVREHPAVKQAAVASGIRYDLLLSSKGAPRDATSHRYIKEVIRHHVSGRLKVAPEHTELQVLQLVRKPAFETFISFKKIFDQLAREAGLQLQLLPYFISSLPGSGEEEMGRLALKTRQLGYRLEQIQDLTPTPLTLATAIYYSGYHPETLKPVSTAHTKRDKDNQRRYFFWYQPSNRRWLRERLLKLGLAELGRELLKQ
ncbi:MAG: YgiQ family radical SAM protein [Candidatus Delongbacteria bacterium]|nr:YgiQ family radical SAM protein [Candidatus Delongbacteria bacterium]